LILEEQRRKMKVVETKTRGEAFQKQRFPFPLPDTVHREAKRRVPCSGVDLAGSPPLKAAPAPEEVGIR